MGAGLSFGCFFLAGLMFLTMAGPFPRQDGIVLMSIGLFLVGTAFFAGSMLWFAAEKLAPKQPGIPDAPGRPWSPKALLITVFAAVLGLAVIYAFRVLVHFPPLPVS